MTGWSSDGLRFAKVLLGQSLIQIKLKKKGGKRLDLSNVSTDVKGLGVGNTVVMCAPDFNWSALDAKMWYSVSGMNFLDFTWYNNLPFRSNVSLLPSNLLLKILSETWCVKCKWFANLTILSENWNI